MVAICFLLLSPGSLCASRQRQVLLFFIKYKGRKTLKWRTFWESTSSGQKWHLVILEDQGNATKSWVLPEPQFPHLTGRAWG